MLQRFMIVVACVVCMPNHVRADIQEPGAATSLTIQEFFPEVLDAQGVLAGIIDSKHFMRMAPATWRSLNDAPGGNSAGGMVVVRFAIEQLHEKVGVLFLVIDKRGGTYSRFREFVPYDLPSDNFLDSEALRTRFINLQKDYQTMRRQASRNLEQREERRRNARLEASLGQIASLGVQRLSNESVNRGLPESSLHTEEVLRLLTEKLQTSKPPRSLAIREQRIRNHLQELSRMVLAKDTSNQYRDSEGYTVEEKVRLIEENRSEHIFLLEQELARLTSSNEL